MSEQEKVTLNWAIFATDVSQVADRIKSRNKKYDAIVAITRGGLIPAAILAHKLDIRTIDTIEVHSYTDLHVQKEAKVNRTCEVELILKKGKNILIVDELIDSGKTLEAVKRLLPQADTAVVYAKPKSKDYVEFYAREMPENIWIVFPWE